jgi:hypothetical protein
MPIAGIRLGAVAVLKVCGLKERAVASPARVEKRITLEEFLRLPAIDEHPYLEYFAGFSTANGCALIDPRSKTVWAYRPGRRAARLSAGGVLDGGPALPGYRLAVSEIFDWLQVKKRNPQASRQGPDPSAPGVPTR